MRVPLLSEHHHDSTPSRERICGGVSPGSCDDDDDGDDDDDFGAGDSEWNVETSLCYGDKYPKDNSAHHTFRVIVTSGYTNCLRGTQK